jgi:hypothetical protein
VRLVRSKLTETELADAIAEDLNGTIIALTADTLDLLPEFQSRLEATYIPVYYGPKAGGGPIRVAFGPPLPPRANRSEVDQALQAAAALPDEELEVH